PLTYRIFKNTIVLKRMESPETITVPIVQTAISGRVTDTQGEPLTGVSIMLQGTSTGTVSDNDGRYVLNVPNSAGTLVFTYVGFVAQAVTIGGRTTIDVQLEASSESLSEIVVIGYGTQRRSDLTGSITSVSAEQIEGQAFSNVNQALQGKVAGADITSTSGEPGGPVQVRIRGQGTFNNSGPLYVVDGVPMPGDNINAINPNDIASVNILKDASASAIYGSRAANGVILITTKKGQSGETQLNYNGYYGVQSFTD